MKNSINPNKRMIFRKTEIHRLNFALRIALPKQCMENVSVSCL